MDVSLVISIVSASTALGVAVANHWWRVEQDLRQGAMGLTAAHIVAARHVVGSAAQRDKGDLSEEERDEFVKAAFTLMWAVQGAQFHGRRIKWSAIGITEARALYKQVELIVKDLDKALIRHGEGVKYADSLKATNEVLRGLPPVKTRFRTRTVVERPAVELTPVLPADGSAP